MQGRNQQRRALETILPLLILDVEATQRLTKAPDAERSRSTERGASLVRAAVMWETLRERYQIDLVLQVLEWLDSQSHVQALAVWYEYVDKWPEYEPNNRKARAEEGLWWMVDHIYEDLNIYGPNLVPKAVRMQRRDELIVYQKHILLMTVNQIAVYHGLKPLRIKRILKKNRQSARPDGPVV